MFVVTQGVSFLFVAKFLDRRIKGLRRVSQLWCCWVVDLLVNRSCMGRRRVLVLLQLLPQLVRWLPPRLGQVRLLQELPRDTARAGLMCSCSLCGLSNNGAETSSCRMDSTQQRTSAPTGTKTGGGFEWGDYHDVDNEDTGANWALGDGIENFGGPRYYFVCTSFKGLRRS